MSKWYEAKPEDINISDDGKEIEIYITSDDEGSIWSIIPIEYIKELINSLGQVDDNNNPAESRFDKRG